MMNSKPVSEMSYTDLCIEETVVDMEQWDAYREGDIERCNDLYARLVEIRNELDKRELAVSEEDEIVDIDEVMKWAYNEALDMIKEEN